MIDVLVFVVITNSVEISPWRPPKTFRDSISIRLLWRLTSPLPSL